MWRRAQRPAHFALPRALRPALILRCHQPHRPLIESKRPMGGRHQPVRIAWIQISHTNIVYDAGNGPATRHRYGHLTNLTAREYRKEFPSIQHSKVGRCSFIGERESGSCGGKKSHTHTHVCVCVCVCVCIKIYLYIWRICIQLAGRGRRKINNSKRKKGKKEDGAKHAPFSPAEAGDPADEFPTFHPHLRQNQMKQRKRNIDD